MQIRTSRLLLLLLFTATFAASWTWGETFYVTIPEKEAAPPLKQSDISVKLDKKAVPVTEFFSVDAASRTPQVLQHPAGRRQFVMVFDLIFGKPEELVQHRRTAVSLIDKLGTQDLAAVAVLSRLYGMRFWSGLTNDRDKLYTALNAIGMEKVPGMIFGPDGNLYSDTISETSNKVELFSDEQFMKNIVAAQTPPDEKSKKRMAAQEPTSLFITSLSDLSYSMAGVQGPKAIILFSPGFETKGAKIQMDEKSFADKYVEEVIVQPEYLGTVEEERANAESQRRAENEKAFNTSPVIQVEGIPEFVSGTLCSVVAVSPGQPEYTFFRDLTGRTGGLYLRDPQETADAAGRILTLDRKYYVVGFEGKREKQYHDLHSLRVESGAELLNPSPAYVPPRNFDQYTPVERHLHVSQAQYKNFNEPVQGQRFWADFVYQQGPKIALFSQVPGASILKQDVNQYAMEAYGFFTDATGEIVDFSVVPVRFDLKNKQLRERLNKAGVKVWSVVLGHQGTGTVRWILVDSQFGDTTTWSAPLEIPESDLTTSNPFVPSTNFDWLIWPKPQEAQARRGVQFQYPYSMGADLFFPELNPNVNRSDKDKVLYFRIYNRPPESKNPPIHLYLVDNSGKQTEIQQFALMQKPKEVERGGMELFWKLMAMPDVPPGSYLLQVNIRDAVKKKDVVREMPLEIK